MRGCVTIFAKYLSVVVLLAAGAALACDCFEFRNTTAVIASPTMGSGYLSLVSEKDDVLQSLSSDCCDAVELHKTTMDNGIMRMRKLESLPIKAGVPIEILGEKSKGDALHLMLIGLHKNYKPGEKITINFTFAKEKAHKAIFKVVKRGAAPPADDGMAGIQHHGH